jgi:non-ribosomal peptide synthetase component F
MSFNLAVILTETAKSSPERPVAVFDGDRLTYRELDQASDLVASAAYRCPRVFQFRSELPKNTLGRVLKDELVRGYGARP